MPPCPPVPSRPLCASPCTVLTAILLIWTVLLASPPLTLSGTTGGQLAHAFESRTLCASGAENVRLGPFLIRHASPFQLLRVNATPLSGERVPRGALLLNATATWTNRWAYKQGRYLIDGEFLHLSLSGVYGLTDWLQLRLEVPFGVRGGGFLDGAIFDFHEAFGYAQAGREFFPADDFRLILWRKDGTVFSLGPQDAGIGMEDMVLGAKFRLHDGRGPFPLTYASLQMQIPTGDEAQLWGAGSPAGLVSLHLAKRFCRLYFYLDLQYTRFGSGDLVGIPMNQDQWSAVFTTEWSITDRISLVGQYEWNSPAAKDFHEFSRSTHFVAVGIKALISRETVLSLAVEENVFFYDNSPDISAFFAVSRRF